MQFQVNPTNIGWHRRADVQLYDGERRVLGLHHAFTVYP
jgi:hypothetical protein